MKLLTFNEFVKKVDWSEVSKKSLFAECEKSLTAISDYFICYMFFPKKYITTDFEIKIRFWVWHPISILYFLICSFVIITLCLPLVGLIKLFNVHKETGNELLRLLPYLFTSLFGVPENSIKYNEKNIFKLKKELLKRVLKNEV